VAFASAGSAAWRVGAMVAVAGCFGGIVSSFATRITGAGFEPAFGAWDPLVTGLLGVLASLVFVFVLANTDRRDKLRLLALAAIAGFAWNPVLAAGEAYIGQRSEAKDVAGYEEAVRELTRLTSAYEAAEGETERSELAEAIEMQFETVERRASEVDSLAVHRAQLPKAIEALNRSEALEESTSAADGLRRRVLALNERLDPMESESMRRLAPMPAVVVRPLEEASSLVASAEWEAAATEPGLEGASWVESVESVERLGIWRERLLRELVATGYLERLESRFREALLERDARFEALLPDVEEVHREVVNEMVKEMRESWRVERESEGR